MLRTRAYYSPVIRFLRKESSCRSLSGLIKQKFDQGRTQEYKTDGVTSNGTSRIQKVLKEEDAKEKSLQFIKTVVNYLLPKGYPGSVRSGYERFAVGQFTSNTLSTAAGVLSMQALLYAMGIGMGAVGMNTAPLAATLNWVIKDGLGQLGGVVFASFVNNRFDADPKRWRLTATIAMDAASFIEMLTPLVPGYFLAVASIANVSKNISFLAASASRAAIHRSFTLQENLADVTAKTGSQFIVSSLLGTSLGVSLSGLVAWGVTGADAQYASTVGMYCALSSVSIAVTYWSLRHATITSLSPARLDYVLHTYLLPLLHPDPSAEPSRLGRDYWRDRQLLSPEQLRQAEAHLGVPALMAPIGHGGADVAVRLPNLRVGCDLDEVVADREELQVLLDLYKSEQFIINAVTTEHKVGTVHLLFRDSATQRDILRAHILAFVVRTLLWRSGYASEPPQLLRTFGRTGSDCRTQCVDVLQDALSIVTARDAKDDTENLLEELERKLISDRDWRVSDTLLERRVARLCT